MFLAAADTSAAVVSSGCPSNRSSSSTPPSRSRLPSAATATGAGRATRLARKGFLRPRCVSRSRSPSRSRSRSRSVRRSRRVRLVRLGAESCAIPVRGGLGEVAASARVQADRQPAAALGSYESQRSILSDTYSCPAAAPSPKIATPSLQNYPQTNPPAQAPTSIYSFS